MPRNSFKAGARDSVPIALGYISVSFAFGISAARGGLSVVQAVLISLFNVTSAGQMAGLSLMLASASLIEMAAAQFIINLRYALMSLSLSQRLHRSVTLLERFLIAFCNTDEIFAVATGGEGEVGFRYMLGLIIPPYFGWALGTLLGAAAGSILPAMIQSALGIAIYGMFIAIIVPPAKKDRRVLTVVALAAALSCLMRFLLPEISSGFAIIICALVSSAAGSVFFSAPGEAEA